MVDKIKTIMSSKYSISIQQLIGTSVHTREASGMLVDRILESSSEMIEIDFSGVRFISRSFADEFYSDKLTMERDKGKIIVISGASEMVMKMIKAVSRTQDKKERNIPDTPIYEFDRKEDILNFLSDF